MIPLVNIIIYLALKRFAASAPYDVKQHVAALLKRTVAQIHLQGFLRDGDEIGGSLLAIMQTVEKLTKNGKLFVKYPFQNHAFQAHVTRVARKLSGCSKAAGTWKRFLHIMEKHARMIYPAGNQVRLDLSRQRGTLKSYKGPVKIKIVQKKHALSASELDQVMEIERESFSLSFAREFYQSCVMDCPPTRFICAKEGKSDQIIGFLVERLGHIQVVARRANAACLGVGFKLFQGLAHSYSKSGMCPNSLHLEMRPGNSSAMKLYKRLGFSTSGFSEEGYYQLPTEPALLMKCSLAKFLKSTSSA